MMPVDGAPSRVVGYPDGRPVPDPADGEGG